MSISGDGRFVAFASFNNDLVRGDTNLCTSDLRMDVFVRDRVSGTTERVSVGPSGVPGDGNSRIPVISDDGRYVAFASRATNSSAPGDDTNGLEDVFVLRPLRRDGVPVTDCVPRTERVSVGDDEERSGRIDEGARQPRHVGRRPLTSPSTSAATNLPFGSSSGAPRSTCAIGSRARPSRSPSEASRSAPVDLRPTAAIVAYQFVEGSAAAPIDDIACRRSRDRLRPTS